MKTGQTSLSVVQVNYAFDKELKDPEALLDRYTTLTGWSEALRAAGAGRSSVVQQFHRPAQLSRNGVDYFFVDGGVSSAAAQLDAHIAHVNGLVFPLRTWRLRRALPSSTAIVVQNHSDGTEVGRAPLFRLEGRACRGAVDAFLFAAEEHAAAWRRAGFVGPRQRTFCVMPASSSVAPIPRAAAQDSTGIGSRPAILWVGRLNTNKDPLTVIEAFASCLHALPQATLTMVYGTDELIGRVRARVEQSPELRDRVRLVGAVPHSRMTAVFSAADLFVVGSHHEGSGYALMEALACGVTPVVTDIPTFGLLTGGGRVGSLWKAGDAAACARALVDAAQRDLDAERPRVRDHFAQHFSWSAIGGRAMKIYSEVMNSRQSSVVSP